MTPDEIISKWIGIGLFDDEPIVTEMENAIINGLRADIQQAINAAVKEEREACAKIADEHYHSVNPEDYAAAYKTVTARAIREAIRERCNGGTK